MKYKVTVAFSLYQIFDIEADSKDEAMQTAWDKFDQNEAVLGDGEIVRVEAEGESND
jgi:hypothetical protein